MSKQARKRNQVVEITIPVGTTAGEVKTFPVTIDKEYSKIIGYKSEEVSNPATFDYAIGIRNEAGYLTDMVMANHLQTNPATPMDKRYMETDAPGGGINYVIEYKPLQTVTAGNAIVFQVVFSLEK